MLSNQRTREPLMPARPLPFALLLLAGCTGGDRPPAADTTAVAPPDSVADTTAAADTGRFIIDQLDVIRVNPGPRGMAGVVRWVFSPDSTALLAIEDWVSVEAEAFFDGFLLASERTGTWVREDSVWDAAPSPDWTRVAYGLATRIIGGEGDSMPPESLAVVAHRLGVSVAEVRASAFMASGMAPAMGLARLGIADVAFGQKRTLPLLAGWNVRWSRRGDRVFAGLGPEMVNDDAPSRAWVSVTPERGDSAVSHTGSLDSARVRWRTGPTLDISVDPDTGEVVIATAGRIISSQGGELKVDSVSVGDGFALAATRQGCYVLALVRDTTAGEYDPKWRAAMLDTGCPRPQPAAP